MNQNIYNVMQDDISNSNISEEDKSKLLKNLIQLKEKKINLMITGATGCGKSSTINALFDADVAKVGVGVDPETMDIAKYELENLVLWDSPGLGDGKETDTIHSKNIIKKLAEVDENGDGLIDLVLVLLDGSTRDLGTSYELINQVIIPNLGDNKEGRILVAINQADVAMKGKYWNEKENRPEVKLKKFLDEKVISVKRRIKEGTDINVEPIYYCAGFKEEGELQSRPYNLSKLLYFIIKATPSEKRLAYVDNINTTEGMWEDNDDIKNYNAEIRNIFVETIKENAASGSEIGGAIGSIFGKTGEAIGKTCGTAVGAVIGIFKGIFS